jgi:hypothetical protein
MGIVAVTYYSALHPTYEHKTISVPAELLPLKVFQATQPIIPTGIKTYPATYAHGWLTFSNGSVIGQSVPVGYVIDNVVTDRPVYVPGATANGFGIVTVAAHMVISGTNLPTLAVNEVVGSSLFIRNLSPFTGGRPAYSVQFVTEQDKSAAMAKARNNLASRVIGLHYPCSENQFRDVSKMVVTWRCQFLTYHVPPNMHVTNVQIQGKNLLLNVWFIPVPKPIYRR